MEIQHSERVLVAGACTLDFTAQVDEFPKPDSKIRTTAFTVLGGGNAGNTATTLSRLGLETNIVTKIGTDPNGQLIYQGLEAEGIDLSLAAISSRVRSSLTYVIVDTKESTRTCIHTPSDEDLLPEEVVQLDLQRFSHVHFDSRHTLAAATIAHAALAAGVPTSIDAEKNRPHMEDLLPYIEYVFTNQHFPKAYTGCENHVEAMVRLLNLGRARVVISTLGARGSIAVYKDGTDAWICAGGKLPSASNEGRLQLDRAFLDHYEDEIVIDGVVYHSIAVGAKPIASDQIVDTTGAGDAYIGGAIYGRLQHYSLVESMMIGTVVASHKLTQLGARAGIPTADILQSLLS